PRRASRPAASTVGARALSSQPLPEPVVTGVDVDPSAGESSVRDSLPEGLEEIATPSEVGHLDEGAADLGRAMRIASGSADDVVLSGVRGGRAIVQEDSLARVEDLEGVDLRTQPIERRATHV